MKQFTLNASSTSFVILLVSIGLITASAHAERDHADRPALQMSSGVELVDVHISPDSAHILIGSSGTATLWDVATGRQVRQFRVPKGWGSMFQKMRAHFSPGGHYVVMYYIRGGIDFRFDDTNAPDLQEGLTLLDLSTGQVIYSVPESERVTASAVSPDDRTVVLGLADGSVVNVEISTHKTLPSVRAHSGFVEEIVFSSRGNIFVSRANDGSTWLWNTAGGKKILQVSDERPGSNLRLAALTQCFSKDGATVVGIIEGEARRWRTEDIQNEVRLKSPQGTIVSASVSEDGQFIITGGTDAAVRLWDATKGDELKRFSQFPHIPDAVAFLPGGMEIITESVGKDGNLQGTHNLRRWNIEQSLLAERYRGIPVSVNAVTISDDGRYVLTGTDEGEALLWDLEKGREISRLRGHEAPVNSVAFLRDGRLATGGHTNRIKFWEQSSGNELGDLQLPKEEMLISGVVRFAASPNCEHIVVAGKTPQLWDSNSKHIRSFTGLPQAPDHIALSYDGRTVAASSGDGTVMAWGVYEGNSVLRIPGGKGLEVSALAVSADGGLVIAARDDGTIRLWNAAKDPRERILQAKELVRGEEGRNFGITSISFSKDGRKVVAGNEYCRAGIWDVRTGRQEKELQILSGKSDVFDGQVLAVDMSGDGKSFLTGENDGTARAWKTSDGKCSAELVHSGPTVVQSIHLMGDGSCAFRTLSEKIVVFSSDGKADLMALDVDVDVEKSTVASIDFSSNGKTLALVRWPEFLPTGLEEIPVERPESSIEIWDIPTGMRRYVFHRPYYSAVTSVAFDSQTNAIVTAGSGDLRIWGGNETGSPQRVYHLGTKHDDVSLSKDSRIAFLRPRMKANAKVIETKSGKVMADLPKPPNYGYEPTISLSGDGRWVIWNESEDSARIFDVQASKVYGRIQHNGLMEAALSANGDYVLTAGKDNFARLWDRKSGRLLREVLGHTEKPTRKNDKYSSTSVSSPVFSSDAKWFAFTSSGDSKHLVTVCSLNGKTAQRLAPLENEVLSRVAISPDGTTVSAAAVGRPCIGIWEVRTGVLKFTLDGHTNQVADLAYSSDGSFLASSGYDGMTKLWDVDDGHLVCTLIDRADKDWAVVAPDGRFDSGNLDSIRGFSWIFPDDPLRPLAPEILLRDYYEPKLLPASLHRDSFRRIRQLEDLNRAQPIVGDIGIDGAFATVQVSANEHSFERNGKPVLMRTDVYDLRLFRNGQLVGRWPEPRDDGEAEFDPDPTSAEDMKKWRELNRVKADGQRVIADADGKMTVSFPVRLPSRPEPGPVEFTAYAFNEDRVKSETARFTYQAPAQPATKKPRAYLVCVGVSACQTKAWDLAFAAKDAQLIAASMDRALKDRYDVVPVVLTSQYAEDVASAAATKENLHATLDLLAGKPVDASIRERLPHGSKLQVTTPDDLVLVSFSGHGYTDTRGALHLIPYDVGSGQKSVTDAQSRCISSGELSAWLRGIDAGETVLVVDACHSAAAIAEPGFKPGPLGNRGLGQLAYDKGMRVLAAAQEDDVALESRKVKQGLLTYALVRDGLEQQRAAKDGKITLGGLLTYAAERVPSLYEEVVAGKVKDAAGEKPRDVDGVQPKDPNKSRVQRPELFDYAKKRADVSLTSFSLAE